ncbi:MAG TPA: DUF3618 domain-containing protein [Chloroflexaceae bacterium]|nr:DUF3618 domain-containing protein [Chloroflexaceae bacterium]
MNRDALARAAADAARDDSTPETAEIRAEIEQTRSQMGETIEAIQARLTPEHIGQQVKEQVREQIQEVTATVRHATIGRAEEMARHASESIDEARYGLMETIKHNPVPAAMAAIGLGWLLMNRRSAPPRYYAERALRRGSERHYAGPERYYAGEAAYPYGPGAPGAYTYGYQGGYYEYEGSEEHRRGMARRAQEAAGDAVGRAQGAVGSAAGRAQDAVGGAAGQARDAAGNLIEQTRDAAGNLIEQTRDAAGNLVGQAQHQARRVEHRLHDTANDNPLGLGAIALALGAAVGFGLPQTERENQLMGEARDNLVEKAQEVAQDTVEKVQRVAGDAAETAQQTARESAKEQGLAGEKRMS